MHGSGSGELFHFAADLRVPCPFSPYPWVPDLEGLGKLLSELRPLPNGPMPPSDSRRNYWAADRAPALHGGASMPA